MTRRIMNGIDTKEEIMANVCELYGYTPNTAEKYWKKAQRAIQMWQVHDMEVIRCKNLARLDEITENAIDSGDMQSAIKAIDVMNKTAAVYVDKQINVTGDNIRFEFGQ